MTQPASHDTADRTDSERLITFDQLRFAIQWAQYRTWDVSDEERDAVDELTRDAWFALSNAPQGLRPSVTPGVDRFGVTASGTDQFGVTTGSPSRPVVSSGVCVVPDEAVEAAARIAEGGGLLLHARCDSYCTKRIHEREVIADMLAASADGWAERERQLRDEIADEILAHASAYGDGGVRIMGFAAWIAREGSHE